MPIEPTRVCIVENEFNVPIALSVCALVCDRSSASVPSRRRPPCCALSCCRLSLSVWSSWLSPHHYTNSHRTIAGQLLRLHQQPLDNRRSVITSTQTATGQSQVSSYVYTNSHWTIAGQLLRLHKQPQDNRRSVHTSTPTATGQSQVSSYIYTENHRIIAGQLLRLHQQLLDNRRSVHTSAQTAARQSQVSSYVTQSLEQLTFSPPLHRRPQDNRRSVQVLLSL